MEIEGQYSRWVSRESRGTLPGDLTGLGPTTPAHPATGTPDAMRQTVSPRENGTAGGAETENSCILTKSVYSTLGCESWDI